ncbi:lebercilin-like [Cololabis saira]|uniref:lebercilin-like n=1 Tax=Cololabis saira TaxID=129043 RepID=UPI002AD3B5FD|nr:lebercilin-like [Cololabis saira]
MKKTQLSLVQKANEEGDGVGDGDAAWSSDTSRWSTPSWLDCDSDAPQSGRKDNLLINTLDNHLSPKWKQSKKSGFKKGKNVQETSKPSVQDNSVEKNTARSQGHTLQTTGQSTKLPPIKPQQVSTSNVHSASTICVKELKSQVWALQQELSEVRTENKLLKKIQHRYTVALQRHQDSESSIPQILEKHNKETRALKGLLRETRISRDNATRQLQATESKLHETKVDLQHLKLLSQDQHLLEREELSLSLAKAYAKLEDKESRIQEMEKNLALCQASFKRQIVTEQRKIKEATMLSSYQQWQISQLSEEIQDKEKELKQHYIYSHRYIKGSNKKVQKDGLPCTQITASGSDLLETQHSITEQQETSGSCQGDLDVEALEEKAPSNAALGNHKKDTRMLADWSGPEDPLKQLTAKGKEASEKSSGL